MDTALVEAATKCVFCPWLMHIVNAMRSGFGDPYATYIKGFEQAGSFCVLCRALELEQYS